MLRLANIATALQTTSDYLLGIEKDDYNFPKIERLLARNSTTIESISNRREFFLGKSVAKIEHVLHDNGYETRRRFSKHATSRAKIIVTTNHSADRNITQVQVSPGSSRHGNVPYVKISTSDQGKIKIIGASKEQYKTDNTEKATILFRRKK